MTKFDISAYITGEGKTKGDKREFALCKYYGIHRDTHDRSPYYSNSDIELGELNISVKASGATLMSGSLCRGCQTFEGIWRRFRKNVHSNRFAYVTTDFMVYMMDIDEFSKFVHAFGGLDHESSRNGGGLKIKLRNESKPMLRWLDTQADKSARRRGK